MSISRFVLPILTVVTTACSGTGALTVGGNPLNPTPNSSQSAGDWTFDAGTESSYAFDENQIEFANGVARLKPFDQTDDALGADGFGGGVAAGTGWRNTSGNYQLSQSVGATNRSELDESWTPQYASLIGYWTLNGPGAGSASGQSFVSAIGNHTGVGAGSTLAHASGKLNQAVSFGGPGTSDSIAIPDAPALRVTGPLTLMAWVQPRNFLCGPGSTTQRIAQKYESGTSSFSMSINGDCDINPGAFGFRIVRPSIDINLSTDAATALGQWNHVAVTFDGTTPRLYLNGVQQTTSDPGTYNAFANSDLLIGNRGNGNTFDGLIDDFGFWGAELTAAEIARIYLRQVARYSGTFTSRTLDALDPLQPWTSLAWKSPMPFGKPLPDATCGAAPCAHDVSETAVSYPALVGSNGNVGDDDLTDGLIGLWHLDETAATLGAYNDFKDTSGRGNHGEAGAPVKFGAPSVFGRAAHFPNGANSQIDLKNTVQFDAGNFTISNWFQSTLEIGSTAAMYGFGDGGGAQHIEGATLNRKVKIYIGAATGGSTTLESARTFTDGTWHHALVTRTGNDFALYVDGVLEASVTAALGDVDAPGVLPRIGTGSGPDVGDHFQGSIAEMGIWNRALHLNEIKQLYRRGANRIRFQVRSCTLANCADDASGALWQGPNGSRYTYFSELDNRAVPGAVSSGIVKPASANLDLTAFSSPVPARQYFQYRAVLESDDAGTSCDYGSGPAWCSPELRSVTVGPNHYAKTATLTSATGIAMTSLATFTETLGAAACSGGGVTYTVSNDGTLFYYWNGSVWAISDGSVLQSSSAIDASLHAAAFFRTAGTGSLRVRALLRSSGTSACELDRLVFAGTN